MGTLHFALFPLSIETLFPTAEVLAKWKVCAFDNNLFLKLVEALGEEQIPGPVVAAALEVSDVQPILMSSALRAKFGKPLADS